MKNLFLINEDERNRILMLHESATKKQYIKESKMEPDMTEGEIDEDAGLVGTALVMGPIGWAYSALNSGTAGEGARTIFSKCKTKKGKLGKRQQNDATLAQIADKINGAVEGLGTTLPSIKSAFQNVKSIADLCSLSTIYQTRHGESLYDALDGDIDRNDEWKNNVYLPLLDNAVKNSDAEYKALQAASTKTAEETFKNFPCVPTLANKKGIKMESNGSFLIGNFRYFGNGRKGDITTKKVLNYTCDDAEFKTAASSGATAGTTKPKASVPTDADLDKYLTS